MDDEKRSVDRLEMCIRRYLADNPGAADTAEGIAAWWLPLSFGHATPARIEEALNRLIRSGDLARIELPGGTVLYRRAQD